MDTGRTSIGQTKGPLYGTHNDQRSRTNEFLIARAKRVETTPLLERLVLPRKLLRSHLLLTIYVHLLIPIIAWNDLKTYFAPFDRIEWPIDFVPFGGHPKVLNNERLDRAAKKISNSFIHSKSNLQNFTSFIAASFALICCWERWMVWRNSTSSIVFSFSTKSTILLKNSNADRFLLQKRCEKLSLKQPKNFKRRYFNVF